MRCRSPIRGIPPLMNTRYFFGYFCHHNNTYSSTETGCAAHHVPTCHLQDMSFRIRKFHRQGDVYSNIFYGIALQHHSIFLPPSYLFGYHGVTSSSTCCPVRVATMPRSPPGPAALCHPDNPVACVEVQKCSRPRKNASENGGMMSTTAQ